MQLSLAFRKPQLTYRVLFLFCKAMCYCVRQEEMGVDVIHTSLAVSELS